MPHKRKTARKEYNRKYKRLHPEVFAKSLKKFRESNRGRRTEVMRKLGITNAQYDAIFVSQGGLCKVCNKPEPVIKGSKPRRLAIDHDHSTKTMRGLLCTNCNNGLGRFKDDINLLLNAAAYLGWKR